MIAHLLALAVANLCFLAAGAGIGRALGLWRAPRDLPGVVPILYLIGVAASGILATWALVAGLELGAHRRSSWGAPCWLWWVPCRCAGRA